MRHVSGPLARPARAGERAEESSIIYSASWFINEPVSAIQTSKLVSRVLINIDTLTRIRDCAAVLYLYRHIGTMSKILEAYLTTVSCLQRVDGTAATAARPPGKCLR